RGRLIEDHQGSILSKRPCDQYFLELSVAEFKTAAVFEVADFHPFQRLCCLFFIKLTKASKPIGIRLSAQCYQFCRAEVARKGLIGEDQTDLGGKLPGG